MQKKNLKNYRLVIYVLVICAIFSAMIFIVSTPVFVWHRKAVCKSRIETLGKAMLIYAGDYDEVYPTADKWCDLLIEQTSVNRHQGITKKDFKCPANTKARCSYAINPNVSPRSNPRLVLLFETKGGWNQFGGAELLSAENHKGKGCNVLFCDLHVEFIKAEGFGQLKWGSEINDKPIR